MRPDVRKYAMDRVNKLEDERLEAFKKLHTTKGKTLDDKETYDALRANKLPFRKDACSAGVNKYSSIKDIWDIYALNVPDKFNVKAYAKDVKPISLAARKARDFIMLGDEAAALGYIREFEDGAAE